MLKRFLVLFFVFVLTGLIGAADQNCTVYIATSGNGKRYHFQDCRTLKNGKAALTIADAKSRGYTACGICKPGE